jgi:hypothetical protein
VYCSMFHLHQYLQDMARNILIFIMLHLHQYLIGYGKERSDVHNVPLAPISKRIQQGP